MSHSSEGVNMDVLEAIKGRRSVRAFTSQKVSEETVSKLIEAACWAPSAGNIQPWEFIVVRKPKIKKKLVEAALAQLFIAEAPVVIVVCANERHSAQRYGDRGSSLFCVQDTAAAIQNMLLAAYSFGLGTCWIGAFQEGQARQILNIPEEARPVAIIPIGHPAENPPPRPRRPQNKTTHHETYESTTV
jgi:nitroreductase